MTDRDQTAEQLRAELAAVRRQLAELQAAAVPPPPEVGPSPPGSEQFRRIVEHAPVAVGIARVDGAVVLLNNKFTELFGYTRADISTVDHWFTRAYPDPDYRRTNQALWVADLEQGRTQPLRPLPVREYTVTCRDGSRKQVEITFSLIGDHAYVGFTDVTARRRAEAALRDSEERFRQLAEHVSGVFWLTDWATERVIYVSPAYEEIWGRSRDRLYADPWDWLAPLSPEDRERVTASFQTRGEHGPWEEEYRLIRPDGTVRWIRDRGFPIRDDQDRVYRLAGLAEDITDRKEAQDKLRQSEEKFRVAFEAAEDAIFWADAASGLFINCNRAAEHLMERPRDELIGSHFTTLHPVDQAEYYREVFRKHVESGLRTIEAQIVTKTGTLKTVTISAAPFQMGDSRIIQGIFRDITERKHLEESLRFHQLAIEHNADSAFWVAADGRIYYANNAACRVLGYTRPELLALSIFDVDPDLSRETWDDYWQRSRYRGTYILNTHHRTKNGRVFPVEVNITPVEFAGQEYHVSFARDISDRKQWEAALQESEQRFRTLAAASFEGIAMSEAGVILDTNDQLADLLGYSREELIGKPLLEVVAPASRCLVAAAVHSGRLEPYEFLSLRKDGSTFPTRVRARVAQIGGRQLRVSVIRDISDWKAAEAALRQEKEVSEAILDSLPGIFYMFDEHGHFVRWNQRHLEVTGYRAEEMPRMHPLDFFQGADKDLIAARIEEVLLQGEAVAEAAVVTKSGEQIPYYFTGRRVSWEGRTYILGVGFDISARRQAEAALRESEELNRLIISSIQEGILVYDHDLQHTVWNPFMEKLTGLAADQVLGTGPLELFPFLREQGIYALLHRALAGEVVEVPDQPFHIPATGRSGWFSGHYVPYRNARGEIAGVIATVHDLTDRQRAEAERRSLEERMYHLQKLESLGVMAGGIAHDFNNLLMAILGNTDLALLEISPVSPARPYVQEIERASRRAAELCRQMLAYAGKGALAAELVDLSEVVREMAHILKISISPHAVLHCNFADRLPAVKADPAQVRQVIMNLIINASEALGDAPGVIALTTGSRQCDRPYLAQTYLNEDLPAGDYVYLEVADTGCGMDPDTQQKIFDPFFSTKFTGRGLGLAAVLGIVRGHQGAVRVESRPGQGTTITVIFPAAASAAPARPAPPAPSPRLGGNGRVLLIDDEEPVREVGRQMLQYLGYEVLTAADGREGLHLFEQQAPRPLCVILDLTMPVLGGEETFRELRRLQPDIPVIVMSGYHTREVAPRFAGQSAVGFLQKPYTLRDLGEALEKAVPPSAAASGPAAP